MDPDDLYGETEKERKECEDDDLLAMFIATDEAGRGSHRGQGASCLLLLTLVVVGIIVSAFIHR